MRSSRSLVPVWIGVILVFSLVPGCRFSCSDPFGSVVVGNGTVKTVDKELAPFSQVELDGIGKMEITIGPKSAISIKTDENLMSLVQVESKNNRLVVRTSKTAITKHGFVYIVTTPKLDLVDSQGAASMSVTLLNNESFVAKQSGVGSMTLLGKTSKLSAQLSGAGRINALELEAQSVEADVSGVGSVRVNAQKTLKADVSGAGSIVYTGDPVVESHVSGVGSISKKE